MSISKISGFPEWLPSERQFELKVLQNIGQTFDLCGFSNLEMRAVESSNALLSKGETSKEIYLLSRLQNPNVDLSSPKQLGLHFDLTVPFARYVAQNAGHLQFPLRRSSIGKVWRGERPQDGRFREFTQADIDIVATCDGGQSTQKALPIFQDEEIVRTIGTALKNLQCFGFPKAIIHINNRNLLQSAYKIFKVKNYEETLRTIDKLDKLGEDKVFELLTDPQNQNCEQSEVAKKCLDFAKIHCKSAYEFSNALLDMFGKDIKHLEGVEELTELIEAGIEGVEIDLKIARGLDYYTGNVFETTLDGFEKYGSIASGGRYDNLVSQIDSSIKTKYPGVGMSIGVTRLMSIALQNDFYDISDLSPVQIMVAVNSEQSRKDSNKIALQLRERGISAYASPISAKYGKQIEHAYKRGIKEMIFLSDSNSLSIKNLDTGEQREAKLEDF